MEWTILKQRLSVSIPSSKVCTTSSVLIACNIFYFILSDINVILPYLVPICQKWQLLGILLGMNHEELAKLQGEPIACLGAVISSWLAGRCSLPSTIESLTGVLRNQAISGESVAANIEQRKANDYYFLIPIQPLALLPCCHILLVKVINLCVGFTC